MDVFIQLFGNLLVFVYHCFDRIVIHGYLSGLSRPEQVVHFFRHIVGVAAVDKEVLSRRTCDYQTWVEAFAHNHGLPIEWAEKGVRQWRCLLVPGCCGTGQAASSSPSLNSVSSRLRVGLAHHMAGDHISEQRSTSSVERARSPQMSVRKAWPLGPRIVTGNTYSRS
jgi:hypothetical protein